MNHDEILAMAPGRKLDILVAEKVMGWQYGNDFIELANGLKGKDGWFNPSSDIAAAFKVVEKLHEGVGPMVLNNNDYRGYFDCGFYIDDVTILQAEAPTAPEAISKAALIAILEGEERNANNA